MYPCIESRLVKACLCCIVLCFMQRGARDSTVVVLECSFNIFFKITFLQIKMLMISMLCIDDTQLLYLLCTMY